MKCPQCGSEAADTMKFCPMCGTALDMFEPVVPVDATPQDNLKGYGKYDYKRKHPEEAEGFVVDPNADFQTQLAQKELHKIKQNGTNDKIHTVIIIIISIISFVAFYVEANIAGFFFLIIAIVYALNISARKRRKEELEHLAKGEKIVNVCPKCKSENIVMNMVQTDSYTTHGVTRISDNMNPLHLFTHTNVRKGADHTTNSYGNQCHCLNCGNVFARPEVHYV